MKRLAILLVGLLVASSCGGGREALVVAVGTTLDDSGFMEAIVQQYEAEFPDREVLVLGRSSPEVLALGRAGSADLLITHAPLLEVEFIAAGFSERDIALFESDFYLVAPPEAAAQLSGRSVSDALLSLVDRTVDVDFVSRGDESGTHHKELELWVDAGGIPHEASWYLETGQGMGPTLQIASQKKAVALTEAGSFLSVSGLGLVAVEVTGPELPNVYLAIVPDGADQGAELFLDWLLAHSDVVERVNRDLFGTLVYRVLP